MTVNVQPTELNKGLATILQSRMFADEFYTASRVAFWRLVGIGTCGLGLGAAIGLAFYGYAQVARNSTNLNSLSTAFAQALEQAKLTGVTEGNVQIQPHEITLAKGQTITLDRKSRVFLEPNATVRAEGQIEIQAPTISIPQNTSRPSQTVPMITNFTVFKRVPFNNGTVMTGWNFLTSSQKSPSDQYCYYTENADSNGLNVVLDIAEDQKMTTPKAIPQGFDMLAAFNRCVWFKGDNQ
jgi:hypothetical protein